LRDGCFCAAIYGVLPAPQRFGHELITFAGSPSGFVISAFIAIAVFIAIPAYAVSMWKTERHIASHLGRWRAPVDSAVRSAEDDR
jgi:NADH:ubiquinone oxidoreductase subunit 4 (subunit M)